MNTNLVLVTTKEQQSLARIIVENYHSYVPHYESMGRRIDWLIEYEKRIVGMIGVGSATYPPPKDLLTFLDMTKKDYGILFNQFANNWRFCLVERIKNLGTTTLKKLRKAAPIEWKKKYGDDLVYLMTFVGGGHDGAVYRADNWTEIGWTSGLPPHKSSSMKWNTATELKSKFVKPTGENQKIIFIKKIGDWWKQVGE